MRISIINFECDIKRENYEERGRGDGHADRGRSKPGGYHIARQSHNQKEINHKDTKTRTKTHKKRSF